MPNPKTTVTTTPNANHGKERHMAKYREILGLHATRVSMRNISFSCKCSKATVKSVVDRAKATSLEWLLPEEKITR